MKASLRKKVINHLLSVAPEEGCGFVLKDGTFVPADNQIENFDMSAKLLKNHTTKDMGFLVDPKIYLKYSRDIQLIVHSHVRDDFDGRDQPSGADMDAQKATNVQWHIFVLSGGECVHDYVFGEVNE